MATILTTRKAATGGAPIDSLAVLPFVNSSHDAQSDFLADGMTDTIINKLSELPQLKVMSHSTMFRFKGKNADPQQVGRDLNVRAVLDGSVRQVGNRLAIETELVNVSDGTQLWGEQYDRPVADVFALQDDIAREISDKLRLKLTGQQQTRLTKHETEDAQAYALYAQGRFYWNKRNPDGLQKALDLFHQAIQRDPNYALAHLGIADSYMIMPSVLGSSTVEATAKAKSAVAKALQIDPGLAEAHATLGLIHHYLWEWTEGEEEFRRAIALNPNYATAHQWYSSLLQDERRFAEALAQIEQAQALDPLSLIINTNHGLILDTIGRRREAIDQIRRTIDLDPTFYYAHAWMCAVLIHAGEPRDALAEAQKAVALSNRAGLPLVALAASYALNDRRADALKIIDEVKAKYDRQRASPTSIGQLYAALNDRPEAYQWFDRALRDRDQYLPQINWFLETQSLRSDPHFQQLLRGVNLVR